MGGAWLGWVGHGWVEGIKLISFHELLAGYITHDDDWCEELSYQQLHVVRRFSVSVFTGEHFCGIITANVPQMTSHKSLPSVDMSTITCCKGDAPSISLSVITCEY